MKIYCTTKTYLQYAIESHLGFSLSGESTSYNPQLLCCLLKWHYCPFACGIDPMVESRPLLLWSPNKSQCFLHQQVMPEFGSKRSLDTRWENSKLQQNNFISYNFTKNRIFFIDKNFWNIIFSNWKLPFKHHVLHTHTWARVMWVGHELECEMVYDVI